MPASLCELPGCKSHTVKIVAPMGVVLQIQGMCFIYKINRSVFLMSARILVLSEERVSYKNN